MFMHHSSTLLRAVRFMSKRCRSTGLCVKLQWRDLPCAAPGFMPLCSALLLLGPGASLSFAGPTSSLTVTYPLSPTEKVTCTASVVGAAASEAGLALLLCCCDA